VEDEIASLGAVIWGVVGLGQSDDDEVLSIAEVKPILLRKDHH